MLQPHPDDGPILHADPPLTMRKVHAEANWIVPFAAGMFLLLAVLAAFDWLPWDRPITEWIADHRTADLNDFWRAVTELGGEQVVWVVALACAAAAWPRCRPLAIAILLLAVTRSLIVISLKEVVARDRPPAALAITHPGGFSFPSGHPFAVAASWGFIPLVIALYVRQRWMWWTSVFAVWTMVVVIAASRVYLGAHYTTDVIATLLLAVVFVVGSELVIGHLHRWNSHSRLACDATTRRRRRSPPETA
jgi:undecaprenyl-diphosphatase